MLKLKVSYNDSNVTIVNKLIESIKDIEFETYNEDVYRERKKAFGLRYEWGTKLSPFAILYAEDKPIKAFYTDDNTFNIDYINNFIKNNYESTSN